MLGSFSSRFGTPVSSSSQGTRAPKTAGSKWYSDFPIIQGRLPFSGQNIWLNQSKPKCDVRPYQREQTPFRLLFHPPRKKEAGPEGVCCRWLAAIHTGNLPQQTENFRRYTTFSVSTEITVSFARHSISTCKSTSEKLHYEQSFFCSKIRGVECQNQRARYSERASEESQSFAFFLADLEREKIARDLLINHSAS